MSQNDTQHSELRPEEVREAIRQNYGDPADGQHYNDRSAIDFDPADGLYSGSAVDGTSEVAGPHENQEPVGMDDQFEPTRDGEITEGPQQRATEAEETSIAED